MTGNVRAHFKLYLCLCFVGRDKIVNSAVFFLSNYLMSHK